MHVFKLSSWEPSGFAKLSQANCRGKEKARYFVLLQSETLCFSLFYFKVWFEKGSLVLKKKKKSLQKHNSRNIKLTLPRQIIIFVLLVSRLHYLQVPSKYTFNISKILMNKLYLYATTSIIAQWKHTGGSELGCFLKSLVTYLIWRV